MRYTLVLLGLAALTPVALGDFVLYLGSFVSGGRRGISRVMSRQTPPPPVSVATQAYVFNGPPACEDLQSYNLWINDDNDATDGGMACDGCFSADEGISGWPVDRLEISSEYCCDNADHAFTDPSITHLTFYKNDDGTYDIKDPADVSHGSCTHVTENPDDFTCEANYGVHFLQCTTEFSVRTE